jgi:hypothetical protein
MCCPGKNRKPEFGGSRSSTCSTFSDSLLCCTILHGERRCRMFFNSGKCPSSMATSPTERESHSKMCEPCCQGIAASSAVNSPETGVAAHCPQSPLRHEKLSGNPHAESSSSNAALPPTVKLCISSAFVRTSCGTWGYSKHPVKLALIAAVRIKRHTRYRLPSESPIIDKRMVTQFQPRLVLWTVWSADIRFTDNFSSRFILQLKVSARNDPEASFRLTF